MQLSSQLTVQIPLYNKVPLNNKPTDRPTSFMMSTVFYGIQVARPKRGGPILLSPLSGRQMQFLDALGLNERVFLDKDIKCMLQCRGKPDD